MNTLLADALERLHFARRYTEMVLSEVRDDDWNVMVGGVTCIAWQAGHLAMADYRLLLERIRGTRETDESLISQDFLKRFGKGSTPSGEGNPPRDEMMQVLVRVRTVAMETLSSLDSAVLAEKPETPHQLFDTKLGSLHWCAAHEMAHNGQISLLRRQCGRDPRW